MNGLHLLIEQHQQATPWVLIVDDDFNIIGGLKDILTDSGYSVDVANTGAEALQLIKDKTFCAMVVDYSLPDTNGIDLSREAKAEQPLLEMILMTGHDRGEVQGLVEKSGLGIEFLRKPVDVSTILSALERAITRQCSRLRIRPYQPKGQGSAPPQPLKLPLRPMPVKSEPRPVRQKAAKSAAPVSLPPFDPEPALTASRSEPWQLLLAGALILLMGFAGGWYVRGIKPPTVIKKIVMMQSPSVAMTIPDRAHGKETQVAFNSDSQSQDTPEVSGRGNNEVAASPDLDEIQVAKSSVKVQEDVP